MSKELLGKLSEPFDVKDVKQRTQGGRKLDYISIDATINRLNDVLGTGWSTSLDSPPNVIQLEGGNYAVVITLTLTALDKTAVGVGADIAKDLDKAVKTALAEAIKKAGHQFGVGLYLWDEAQRDAIEVQRQAVSGDLNALKLLVAQKAAEQGATPTREGIAAHFKVAEDDLDSPEVLASILAR